MEGSKTFFCSSKLPWACERISSKFVGTCRQKGWPAMPYKDVATADCSTYLYLLRTRICKLWSVIPSVRQFRQSCAALQVHIFCAVRKHFVMSRIHVTSSDTFFILF